MKHRYPRPGWRMLAGCLVILLVACAPTVVDAKTPPNNPGAKPAAAPTATATPGAKAPPAAMTPSAKPAQPAATPGAKPAAGEAQFTMDQTLSDEAQLMTIAFDGLAFLTGSLGSDSFFPPGKVADYWGFQYLRDNDPSEMGHNTDFLTKASLNMLYILTPAQRADLAALASRQVASINEYGYKRFVLMKAFRRLLDGDLPAGTTGLDKTAVMAYSAELYKLDGQMSYDRAQVMGGILKSLDATQRAYLDAMVGKGMTSWPNVDEPADLRKLDHDNKVAVMTYAGDLFSWYAGSVEADVYFCPERQGTYFGSFYMKDAPAVGNPGYSIGTNITADMGRAFVAALTPAQAVRITSLVELQRADLLSIVDTRRDVSVLLRRFIAGQSADSAAVQALSEQYGKLDGEIVYNFATQFAKVGQTLSAEQKTALAALRKQTLGDYTPKGAFLYATEIPVPTVPNTDFLFGNTPETPLPTAQPTTQPSPKGTPQPKSNADHIGGKVTAVSGGTITIADAQGQAVKIVTGASTKFTANGQSATLAGVTVGVSIEVSGTRQADGSWQAASIEIGGRPPAGPGPQPQQTPAGGKSR